MGALGVVFGDIGTSPLYAMRTILGESGPVTPDTVYGVTSTVIWSLVVVVTVLYVGVLLREDNQGEGGLLALLGLLRRAGTGARLVAATTVVAMVGAAMFIGDSVITPAISVISAAEGLETASPSLAAWVLPVALTILGGVFVLQHHGSGKIGAVYGPVMVAWFAVLALGGLASLVQDPAAVQALSPHHAVLYFVHDPLTAFLSLGAVVLAVTGGEALYADLGHFGRPAIARAWLFAVLPALLLAYLGEASAVVRDPKAAGDPFYAVVPSWGTIPVLVLATLATVIASQAVIAGGFTVFHQAGGLGLFPFLRTRHPSATESGRIYVPAVNWALAVAVLGVVLLFRSSERLAAAYGVAVAFTMLTTTTLFLVLDHVRGERHPVRRAAAWLGLVVMVVFCAAALPKIPQGGWAPVLIGAVVFVLLWTWWSGQRRLAAARAADEVSPRDLLAELHRSGIEPHRTPHTAVFLTEDDAVAPFALRTITEQAQVLPERVLLLSWQVEDTPGSEAHVNHVELDPFEDCEGVTGLSVTLGYRERLSVQHVLECAIEQHPEALRGVDPGEATYLVSDSIPLVAKGCGMAVWRQRLFVLMARLSTDRVDQLELPRARTIVIGREFQLAVRS
ncbi:potassium transporter Kup [Nocardioides marmoribigeumensis]